MVRKQQTRVPVILYDRFAKLQEKFELFRRMTTLLGEPRCIALEGVTGAGKSTLARYYASQFPSTQSEAGTVKPVFYVQTPAKTTVRSFAEAMLSQLGDPAAGIRIRTSGAQTKLDDRLDGLIRDCNVQLVIVDDF